jgi:hypothetical protein
MTAMDPEPATVLPFVVRHDDDLDDEIAHLQALRNAWSTGLSLLVDRLAELEARRDRRRRTGRRNKI